jgi:hypothetical protein
VACTTMSKALSANGSVVALPTSRRTPAGHRARASAIRAGSRSTPLRFSGRAPQATNSVRSWPSPHPTSSIIAGRNVSTPAERSSPRRPRARS